MAVQIVELTFWWLGSWVSLIWWMQYFFHCVVAVGPALFVEMEESSMRKGEKGGVLEGECLRMVVRVHN